MTRHRHWVVEVAIAARDEAIARDRAALGILYPLAPVFRQLLDTISDAFEALTPVFEQLGQNLGALGQALTPPPPRHAGPYRPGPERSHRPRRHA